MRIKFSSFKDLALKETDICLSSDTKIDNSFQPPSGLILHVNESIPGKLINSFDFKEGSEVIVFEFSFLSKKWLLVGN